MKKSATGSKRWVKRACCLGGAVVILSAAANRGDGRDSTDVPDEHAEIVEFLGDWNDAIATGDRAGVLESYSDAESFAWFEDGTLRYRHRDEVIEALEAFPEATRIETALSDIVTRPVAEGVVHASASYETTLTMPGAEVAFGGVFTAIVEKTDNGWVFSRGHSSSRREAGGMARPGG
ncbi:MAG: nuclear transport factor 2 family protein [Phycisphaerales bacterium JB040]